MHCYPFKSVYIENFSKEIVKYSTPLGLVGQIAGSPLEWDKIQEITIIKKTTFQLSPSFKCMPTSATKLFTARGPTSVNIPIAFPTRNLKKTKQAHSLHILWKYLLNELCSFFSMTVSEPISEHFISPSNEIQKELKKKPQKKILLSIKDFKEKNKWRQKLFNQDLTADLEKNYCVHQKNIFACESIEYVDKHIL